VNPPLEVSHLNLRPSRTETTSRSSHPVCRGPISPANSGHRWCLDMFYPFFTGSDLLGSFRVSFSARLFSPCRKVVPFFIHRHLSSDLRLLVSGQAGFFFRAGMWFHTACSCSPDCVPPRMKLILPFNRLVLPPVSIPQALLATSQQFSMPYCLVCPFWDPSPAPPLVSPSQCTNSGRTLPFSSPPLARPGQVGIFPFLLCVPPFFSQNLSN